MRLELVAPFADVAEATLDWDEASGTLTGSLAATVREMARAAFAAGQVVTDPYPTTYSIDVDPLRSRRELALVLSTRWRVPAELQASLPPPPEEEESDVEVLY